MVITGQRDIDGVCHFIARNFWDTPCLDEWPSRGIVCAGHELGSRSFAIPVALAGHAGLETSAVFRGAPPPAPAGGRAPMVCR